MNRSSTFLVCSLVVAVLLAGCGGGSSSGPVEEPDSSTQAAGSDASTEVTDAGPGDTIPCSTLLPDTDLEVILGAAPDTTNEQAFPGSTTCSWQYFAPNATQQDFLQVMVSIGADQFYVSEMASVAMQGASNDGVETISIEGLGDENFTWVSPPSSYVHVYVRTGDRSVVVSGPSTLYVLSTESTIQDFVYRLFSAAGA